MSVRAYCHHRANGAKIAIRDNAVLHLQRLMIQKLAAYGEVYTVLFVFLWQISNISYTRYNALLLYSRQVGIEVYPPCLSCLSLAMILFSSFRFRFIDSPCRNRSIRFWLYTPFRVLLWCFRLLCFTLACLLIACVYHADNPLSIRHYAVFTPFAGIPRNTIYPKSSSGFDCVVLFVCLPLFRRLTDDSPMPS